MLSVVGRLGRRTLLTRSAARKGHNLEDYYDMAEWQTGMNNPSVEYLVWGGFVAMAAFAVGPLLHSNYYFGGSFLPKASGDAVLVDESW
jgi:hypothetical protein